MLQRSDEPRTTSGEIGRTPRARRFGAGLSAGLVLGALVAVAAVLLVLQNDQQVRFEWLMFDFDAPLWLILAASLVAGGLITELVVTAVRLRHHRAPARRSQAR